MGGRISGLMIGIGLERYKKDDWINSHFLEILTEVHLFNL
jgi:hypothetical protein